MDARKNRKIWISDAFNSARHLCRNLPQLPISESQFSDDKVSWIVGRMPVPLLCFGAEAASSGPLIPG